MYDLVLVKVVHPGGDLFGPLHQLLRMDLLAVPEEVEEGPVRAVLHHDTEDWRLDTDSPERGDVSTIYKLELKLETHSN